MKAGNKLCYPKMLATIFCKNLDIFSLYTAVSEESDLNYVIQKCLSQYFGKTWTFLICILQCQRKVI